MPGPYETPGVIQEILKRRREESRQAMLDKLNEEQIQAQIAAQSRGLDLEAERNQQGQRQVELQAERDKDASLTSLLTRRAAEQGMDLERLDAMGPVPTPIAGMGPELAALARKYNRVRPMPTAPPDFPAIEPPQMLQDVQETYVPPEFEKEEDERKRTSTALSQIRNSPWMTELDRAGVLRGAGAIQNIPEEAFAAPRRIIPIRPGSTQPVEIGPRDIGMEMNYPPSAYQGSFFPPYLSPSGDAVFFTTRPGPDGKPQRVDMPNAAGMTRLGAPETQEWTNAVQMARQNVMNNQRLVADRRDDALHGADLGVINFHRLASPAAKEAARDALVALRRHQKSKVQLPTVEELTSAATQKHNLTPQDQQVVGEMIGILRPYYEFESGSIWDWIF